MALTKVDTQMIYEKSLGISQRAINQSPYSLTVPAGGVAVGSNLYADEVIEYSEGGQDYLVHVYKTSGIFITENDVTADVLVVAGGGSGGNNSNFRGAGGGAGGLVFIPSLSLNKASYTILIGGGGPVGGSLGVNSVFDNGNSKQIIANGGGNGGYGDGEANARDGGSGGGRWYPPQTGKSSTQAVNTIVNGVTYNNSGFGHKGGNSLNVAPFGSGGGGAGGAAPNVSSGNTLSQIGGVGINNFIEVSKGITTVKNSATIGEFEETQNFMNTCQLGVLHTDTKRYLAGGGTSGGFTTLNSNVSAGGGGIGDNTNTTNSNPNCAGSVNCGSGGGGGGAGGSGIVVIRVHL